MVETDVGYYAERRIYNVGGVESATQARLYHGHIDTFAGEKIERHSRGDLEERRFMLVDERHGPLHEVGYTLLAHGYAVHTYTLSHMTHVRRGIKPRLKTAFGKQSRRHVRHRTLAVGARHVYGPEPLLRPA